MKINYLDILNKNMINVFIEVLKNIKKNGLKEGHHLYITFRTNEKKVNIPIWLKNKFPKEMTIVIQYEYWNLLINKSDFKITLSFNDIKSDLTIPFKSVISFADPYANFGLKLINDDKKSSVKKNKIKYNKNNIIDFTEFKKNK
mgnify:CR=1 FL=1|tara:strand:+ start:290 stop:721 length:432 start_codon:yes stop_codon:yes gene_type:complete